MLAFSTYMAITVHFNPHLAAPLATYMTIVAHLAWEDQGQAWLRLFCQAAAVNPALSWDCCEPDVRLAAMSAQPWVAALSLSTTHSMVPHSGSELQEISMRFTQGKYSSPLSCKFWHVCMLCKSPGHPTKDCYMLRSPARRPAPSD